MGMVYCKNEERGPNWTEISSLCKCIGGSDLAKILKRLCQTPAYRSGLPDLIGLNNYIVNMSLTIYYKLGILKEFMEVTFYAK